MSEIGKWPSVKDVAARLGYTKQYVTTLFHTGKLRGISTRVGILIDPASVDEFMRQRDARRKPATDNEPVDRALVT